MKHRCLSKTHPGNPNYGGKGITVCDEWEKSFLVFREWAMSNGYQENLTIERIKSDGNYEPSNCRWATRSQQSANTRRRTIAKGKFKGIAPSKGGKWRAQACKDRKIYYLGEFSSQEEAAKAYDDKIFELFGEFCCLNFPRKEIKA
jgi:hypothetical protein